MPKLKRSIRATIGDTNVGEPSTEDMTVVKDPKDNPTDDQYTSSAVLLGLIIILGATLRFYDLGTESYWFDEIYSLHSAQESLAWHIKSIISVGNAPIYPILSHFWMNAFGSSETAFRSLSALAGIGCIVVMYLVARELFGRKVALVSAFLMSISEFQIYYSQEARYYSVFLLVTLFSFFYFIRALRSGRLSYFALYALSSVLMYYSHTFGLFVLVAQSLYFLLQWNRYRTVKMLWLSCQMVIVLAIAPGLFGSVKGPLSTEAHNIATGTKYWPPDPTLLDVLRIVLKYLFPGRHGLGWTMIALNSLAGMAFFVIGALFFAVLKGKNRSQASPEGRISRVKVSSNNSSELLLVVCWFLCPIILLYISSKLISPMFIPRYVVSASPAFYLLVALGIMMLSKVVPVLVSLGTLMVLIAPGLQGYYSKDVKEQWREVARYVEENSKKEDSVIFAPDEEGQSKCFYWYYRGNLHSCGIDVNLRNNEAAIADELARCTAGSKRFWLIVRGHSTVKEPFRAFFLDRERANKGISLIQHQEFVLISVYLFAIANQCMRSRGSF
jgi:mannosyltransferase